MNEMQIQIKETLIDTLERVFDSTSDICEDVSYGVLMLVRNLFELYDEAGGYQRKAGRKAKTDDE